MVSANKQDAGIGRLERVAHHAFSSLSVHELHLGTSEVRRGGNDIEQLELDAVVVRLI